MAKRIELVRDTQSAGHERRIVESVSVGPDLNDDMGKRRSANVGDEPIQPNRIPERGSHGIDQEGADEGFTFGLVRFGGASLDRRRLLGLGLEHPGPGSGKQPDGQSDSENFSAGELESHP